MYRNLGSVWSNYVARGADRLLLEQIVENRSQLRLLYEAVPGAKVTIVRLRAPMSLIGGRLRGREPSPENELDAARWLAPRMDEWGVEDHTVDNGRRPCREVASEILRLAGWVASPRV